MASADRERGPGRSLPESKRVEAFAQLKRPKRQLKAPAAQFSGLPAGTFSLRGGRGQVPPWSKRALAP